MTRPSSKHVWLQLLVAWHVLLALGAWLAPYAASTQHREHASAPPTRVHFFSDSGMPTRPYVCALQPHPTEVALYQECCSEAFPLRWFAARTDGGVAALGVDEPGRLFLLGTDELGRDVFSRVLSGGLLSLGSGLMAALGALVLAGLVGGVSGFFGGWTDALLSRAGELWMALPLLYLLLAMRAALPIQTPPLAGFAIAVVLISMVGWVQPARLVRGVVLSVRERGYVLAARGFGAGPAYLLRRHILPETRGVFAAQAAVLTPRFVLLEVTLSFLGLGVPEPAASWGTMLSSLRQYPVLVSQWWMFAPGLALVVSLLLFGRWADALERTRLSRHLSKDS
jgi:peptide/nickel transport system permease protein